MSRGVPLVGWYFHAVRQAAQPRAAQQALGSQMPFSGNPRSQNGFTWWGLTIAPLAVGAVGLVVAGFWWLALLTLSLFAYPLARMLGAYRDRNFS
jgi:hypothetical protein